MASRLRVFRSELLFLYPPPLHTTQWLEFRGGLAGVIWGYLIVWVGTLSTGMETPTRMFEYQPLDFMREIGWMTFAGYRRSLHLPV